MYYNIFKAFWQRFLEQFSSHSHILDNKSSQCEIKCIPSQFFFNFRDKSKKSRKTNASVILIFVGKCQDWNLISCSSNPFRLDWFALFYRRYLYVCVCVFVHVGQCGKTFDRFQNKSSLWYHSVKRIPLNRPITNRNFISDFSVCVCVCCFFTLFYFVQFNNKQTHANSSYLSLSWNNNKKQRSVSMLSWNIITVIMILSEWMCAFIFVFDW